MGQKAAGTTKGGQIAARDKSSDDARAKRYPAYPR
jgi:hypothetical protein